ncbi:MAG: hypothetical protein AAB635_01340, partial [Patescibacteria group bacterium]
DAYRILHEMVGNTGKGLTAGQFNTWGIFVKPRVTTLQKSADCTGAADRVQTESFVASSPGNG